jgi:hypothetical protein
VGIVMQAVIEECVGDEPTVELSAADVARIRARIAQFDKEELSFSLDAPPLMQLEAAMPQTQGEVGHRWAQATLVVSGVAAVVILVLSVYPM